MTDRLRCYHDSPVRKDWDNPSPEDVANSLRFAHSVNRRLEETVNELYDEKKTTKAEMEKMRADLDASKLKNTILTSLLSSAVTSAILGAIIAMLKVFAHGR
jgi:hypothetical protein